MHRRRHPSAAAWSLAAALASALAGCAPREGAAAQGQAAGDTFQTLTSRNGRLEVTLTAARSPVTVAGRTFPSRVYNGSYLPPLLRVSPGDSLHLRLVNRLPEPKDTTNLHYHGTSVSPRAPSDDIFVHVAPGGGAHSTFDYRVYFPLGHDRGLFWYHPHPHGRSEDQVLGGMSGLLIVEGMMERAYPWLRGVPERVVFLKDVELPGARDGAPKTRTLNGRTDAALPIRPGEMQLWQIGNVGANSYFDLRIDGHRFWVLARDANPLRRPELADSLFLPPGARAEVLVVGGSPGRHAIRSAAVQTGPQGDPNPAVALGTLVVSGAPVDRAADLARLAERPLVGYAAAEIDSLRAAALTGRRTVVFSETADGKTFFIDGRQFSPGRVDTRVRVGDVEEWTIRNTSGEVHTFHIHQTDFLVTEIDGVAQPADGLHDTVNVPHAAGGRPGEVKIRIPFTNPDIAGTFVYHCHILEHEDGGMMAVIRVDPAR